MSDSITERQAYAEQKEFHQSRREMRTRRIRELHEKGLTVGQIAERLGIPTSSRVTDALKRMGLEPRRGVAGQLW